MATEVWARNPRYYIREALDCGLTNIVWDKGYLHKYRIDPVAFFSLYGGMLPNRILVIGNNEAVEIDATHGFDDPLAVYPVWEYGQDWEMLEELCENNVANDEAIRNDRTIPDAVKPRKNQEHRIVISQVPRMTTGIGRAFLRALTELQDEYPDVIIHVHALYSFRYMFGQGYRACDIDPRPDAAKGKVILPNGKVMTHEKVAEVPHWVELLGFRPADLKIPRNRCIYNIRSALWAAKYFRSTIKFAHKASSPYRASVDETQVPLPVNHAIMVHRVQFDDGDKFLCDFCSVQNSCKFFRVGSVCALPDAEVAELATMFDTRDADTIVEGLGKLLKVQANRAAEARQNELEDETVDEETTKLINSLFDRGLKLAKFLTVPQGGNGGGGNLYIGGQHVHADANPKEVMAAAIRELEGRGIAREDITPDMIKGVLSKAGATEAAGELAAVPEA